MKRDEIVERVVAGLAGPRPPSFLLQVLPGCEYQPRLLSEIQGRLSDVRAKWDCVHISADAVKTESDLVDGLTRKWTDTDDKSELERWTDEQRGEAPATRLRAFFEKRRLLSGRKRLLIIDKFDRVFRKMSSELLAVLRGLEQEALLVCVNASPLTYVELYRLRAKEEPAFTSDYGQMHVRLVVGPLSHAEAKRRWKEVHQLSLEGVWNACFEASYSLAGGLPAAFEVAAGHAKTISSGSQKFLVFRALLEKELRDAFSRLLQYQTGEKSGRLVEAIAKLHVGVDTVADRDWISSHPFAPIILAQDVSASEVRLCSVVLGAAALRVTKESGTRGLDPELLYRRGEYAACSELLDRAPAGGPGLLSEAASMMARVHEDSNGSLYFGPTVRWDKIEQLAGRSASACRDDASAAEFRNWESIAKAQIAERRPPRLVLNGEWRESLRHGVIYLSIRTLAAERERNIVVASYTALPLVEDTLRRYVDLVLRLPLDGTAFTGVNDALLEEWWGPGQFRRPASTEVLSASNLAVIAAVTSAARGEGLFGAPTELARLLTVLADARNVLAHHTSTPKEKVKLALVSWSRTLIDAAARAGQIEIDVEKVSRWIEPPTRFLETS